MKFEVDIDQEKFENVIRNVTSHSNAVSAWKKHRPKFMKGSGVASSSKKLYNGEVDNFDEFIGAIDSAKQKLKDEFAAHYSFLECFKDKVITYVDDNGLLKK